MAKQFFVADPIQMQFINKFRYIFWISQLDCSLLGRHELSNSSSIESGLFRYSSNFSLYCCSSFLLRYISGATSQTYIFSAYFPEFRKHRAFSITLSSWFRLLSWVILLALSELNFIWIRAPRYIETKGRTTWYARSTITNRSSLCSKKLRQVPIP